MECPVKLEVNVAKLYVGGCGGIIETRLAQGSPKGLGNIFVNVLFRHVTDYGTHAVGSLTTGQSSGILRTQLELPPDCRGEYLVGLEVAASYSGESMSWVGKETILVLPGDDSPSSVVQIIRGVDIQGEKAAMGAYINVNLEEAVKAGRIRTIAELLMEASSASARWKDVVLAPQEKNTGASPQHERLAQRTPPAKRPIRKVGLAFLRRWMEAPKACISVSKRYQAAESWTKSPAWWFDISLEKLKSERCPTMYLLCEKSDGCGFHCLRVPAAFVLEKLPLLCRIQDVHREKIRLHLSARDEDRFKDLRGSGQLDFSQCQDNVFPEDVVCRAQALLQHLISKTKDSPPSVITFGDSFRFIFNSRFDKDEVRRLIDIARACTPVALDGLGNILLDTFIVRQDTQRPGAGHWRCVPYDEAAWTRVLGNARLLGEDELPAC
ncbi:MAG: hypothetical protein ACYTKD_05610 [Planctomycetota bacterium]|jgi:hypothetical protein